MRRMLIAVLLCGVVSTALGATNLRVATFRCNVTPDLGEPLIWVTPAAEVIDPLWAKGVVLDDGRARYVLCAVDWCGIGGATDLLFRARIAAAAGTSLSRVAVHSVHQHTAPYIEGDAYNLLRTLEDPPLMMSSGFLQRVTDRLAQSVKEAVARLEPFDRIGIGSARVDRVASARRIFSDGQLITRYSTSGSKPELAALPEGSIDPVIRTITLLAGDKPLARLHYYATHPQSFCCDGRVSSDFVGTAREALEKAENVFQVYFTGCAGDVTVGKYNDSSIEARADLAQRLEEGMKASIAATSIAPAMKLTWRSVRLNLPLKSDPAASAAELRSLLVDSGPLSGQDSYRIAISLAFAERQRPLHACSLQIGRARIIHLPGEPMLEFQRYAQEQGQDDFVVLAGYGDMSPGYLCTDRAFVEGGYEPGASNAGPGTEARVKAAIRKLVGR